MAIRNIVKIGDDILRKVCRTQLKFDEHLHQILDDMAETMYAADGVGLAAPQVGITQRFLVMMDPDTETVYKMINPNIISRSDETVVMEEGCLSVLGPNGLPVYSNVRRPEKVVVEWTNENGDKLSAQMSGVPARIVQHETDHLDGILFIDYLSGVKREMLMRKVNRGHK